MTLFPCRAIAPQLLSLPLQNNVLLFFFAAERSSTKKNEHTRTCADPITLSVRTQNFIRITLTNR